MTGCPFRSCQPKECSSCRFVFQGNRQGRHVMLGDCGNALGDRNAVGMSLSRSSAGLSCTRGPGPAFKGLGLAVAGPGLAPSVAADRIGQQPQSV